MGKLLQLITKLFGKNALSKTLGTRTNVIKLPSNEKKRLIKDELNIEAASELAAQKVLKEAEDLIADIPRMNDQEVLTFTGNLQRLDNKLNPPSAEVVDITTKQPVTKEGIEQLAASQESPLMKRIQETVRDLQINNPYRPGGALDPKMGIVRTAARQVLQKLAREGKINIADPEEAKAIIEGYQGGVDPVEVFRKTFGQDALGDLANLGDELLEIDNRGGSFKELKKILEDEGFFDLQQPKNPVQGRTDEELMKLIKDEDPEKFATGGRVGFNDGGYTFEQFLKDKQQVDKFMSIEELKREYKRMMELKKIRDQRDMVATGGRVGFDDGGILSLEEAKKLNPEMFVDTTTYNPIPENAPNMAADEIAKVIMGTLGMDDDMTSRTFIFESYVMPKRKELMEDFGLTMKEADDLIREGMAKYRTNKATGGRVGFQIGGPAYDATDPIYGSSAITVTPDTIMGPQGNQIQAQTGVNPALQRSQNPFQNLGFLNTQKHFDQNQLLKNAVASGEITPEQYNELGGYDVTQTMAAGNPIMGGIGNLLGSTAYNVVQSLKGDQPFSDIPGDVYRNVKGGMGLISDDLKSKYESIINQQPSAMPQGSPDTIITDGDFKYRVNQDGSRTLLGRIEDKTQQATNYVGPYGDGTKYSYIFGNQDFKNNQFNPDDLSASYKNLYQPSLPTTERMLEHAFNQFKPLQFIGESGYPETIYSDKPMSLKQLQEFENEIIQLQNMGKNVPSRYLDKLNQAIMEASPTPTQDDYYAQNESAIRSGMMPAQRPTMADVAGGLENKYMMEGFDYSQPTNWSPGQPAPEGYRVVNMMGDTFLEKKYPSKQEMAMMMSPLAMMMPPLEGLSGQEYAERYNIPYATGGRVGYAYGSGLKLAQLLQKAGKSLKQAIKEAVDNINPTGDKKLDADMAVDDMLETYSIDRDAVDGYDILNAYDEAYKTIANPKTMSEVETLEAMGANITAKTLELVEKYPGLNSELARKIASDPDPQRKAEVLATIEQAFELMKKGKSSDEVLDIMKQMTDRTKQAGGGLSYLSGF